MFQLKVPILSLVICFCCSNSYSQVDYSMDPMSSFSFVPGQNPNFGPKNLVGNGNLNDWYNYGSCTLNSANWNNLNWTSNPSNCHRPTILIKKFPNDVRYWPYDIRWYKNKADYAQLSFATSLSHLGVSTFKPVEFTAGGDERNYMLFDLTKSTKIGHQYIIQIKYGSTPISDFYMDRFEAVLSDTLPQTIGAHELLDDYTPLFSSDDNALISNSIYTYTDTFVGNGEKFLILGNFDPIDSILTSGTTSPGSFTEWVIDDIFIYDPDCPIAYVLPMQDTILTCDSTTVGLDVQPYLNGVYTWVDNGDTLSHQNHYLSYFADSADHEIIVSVGSGYCYSNDTIHVITQNPYLDIPDTNLFCDSAISITPVIYGVLNGGINILSLQVECLSSSYTHSQFTYGPFTFDAPDTGYYAVSMGYSASGGCTGNILDTFYIGESLPINFTDSAGNVILNKVIYPETCVNMGDGGIEYDDSNYPDSIHYQWIGYSTGDTNEILNLNTSMVHHKIWDNKARCSYISDSIPLNLSSCGIISGEVVRDTNRNCVKEVSDIPVSGTTVIAQPIGNIGITDSLGKFIIYVPPGNYTLGRNFTGTYDELHCSNVGSINIPSSGFIVDTVEHLDTTLITANDIAIESYFNNLPQLGLSSTYDILIKNNSSYNHEVSVLFNCSHDSLIFNYASSPYYTSFSNDTAYYTLPLLSAGQTDVISIPYSIPFDTSILGDSVLFYAFASIDSNELTLANNSFQEDGLIVSPYDPNFKVSNPLVDQNTHWTRVSQRTFTYTINFQNTGNAPAIHVQLVDTIPSLLNLQSFEFINSSHPVQISSFNGILYFDFHNINLPDSSQGQEISQGNVNFKLTSISSAGEGDTIVNFADIYFDNNPAVRTDSAVNVYHRFQNYVYDSVNTCDGTSYFNTYLNSSFTEDTVVNYTYYSDIDEDSIRVFTLDFHPSYTTHDTSYICFGDSIQFEGKYYHAGDTTMDTLFSRYGCDSVHTKHFEAVNPLISTIHSINDSIYISPSSASSLYQWYYHDNIDTLLLTGENDSYISAGNNGIYFVEIVDSNACSITLSQCYIARVEDNISACDQYTWINGVNYTSSNQTDSIVYPGGAFNGCDSTVYLNLTIHSSPSITDQINNCEPYTWIDGITYTSSNSTAYLVYPGASVDGCDSTVFLDLNIYDFDPIISTNQTSMSVQSSATPSQYQWFTCDNNILTPIPGATLSSFNGSYGTEYAVVVGNGICSDTSDCILLNPVGLDGFSGNKEIVIYPNPNNSDIFIIKSQNRITRVRLFDMAGKLIHSYAAPQSTYKVSSLQNGQYLIEIETVDGIYREKLILIK